MNRQNLEQRLRDDAKRLQASPPPHIRRRVAVRIRAGEGRPSQRRQGFPALPALAGALGALIVFVSVWLLWQPPSPERPIVATSDLSAMPVVARSDRMLASGEAALQDELQLIGRDLRDLRDRIIAPFDANPNG